MHASVWKSDSGNESIDTGDRRQQTRENVQPAGGAEDEPVPLLHLPALLLLWNPPTLPSSGLIRRVPPCKSEPQCSSGDEGNGASSHCLDCQENLC
ncbi:hypothetical protein XELAEV_18008329mg [Xenopus laevis]|uniref:Uncharacterized protein n=1 Tax=Xenopus laevis TaxID=8355 RepID=A0A974E3G5_XENLA|nr:hypothetical protein XELAEV_18008329mg [Xenopus laevis]